MDEATPSAPVSDMPIADLGDLMRQLGWRVSDLDIEIDIDNGAPSNDNGNVNGIKYCAWLLKSVEGYDG